MIPAWIEPAQNQNSDVLSAPLPVPHEVTYSDQVFNKGPTVLFGDVFGSAEAEIGVIVGWPSVFTITLRLNHLFDTVLVDRLE